MPEQIWCHQEIQKSLETLSRDFFVGGKTLLITPEKDPLDRHFHAFIKSLLVKLESFEQVVTVAGFSFNGIPTLARRRARFAFVKSMPLTIEEKSFFGNKSKREMAPEIESVGLMEDVQDCSQIVLAGYARPSARFGIEGLVSLATTVLPTVTLAKAYLSNQCKAFAEIFAGSIMPKLAFSFIMTPSNIISGLDPFATESCAARVCGVPLKADRLLSKSARFDLGDPFLSMTIVNGHPAKDSVIPAKTGSKPKVDKKKCNLCLDCTDVCPNESLQNANGMIAIGRLCVKCGACVDVCPELALG